MQIVIPLSLSILLQLCYSTSGQITAASYPDDDSVGVNEWQRQFPTVVICILARNKAHTLPYFFGYLEELDYPKDRIKLFIRTDHNIDGTKDLLLKWAESVRDFYHEIDFRFDPSAGTEDKYEDERGPFDWRPEKRRRVILKFKEDALKFARRSWADYIFYVDCDVFLTNQRTLQALMLTRKPIVAPFLAPPTGEDFKFSTFLIEEEDNGSITYDFIFNRDQPGVWPVKFAYSAVLIDLRHVSTLQLTFEPENLLSYKGYLDDLYVFTESVKHAGLRYHLDNRQKYGWILPPMSQDLTELDFDAENMRYLSLEALYDGVSGLLHSPFIAPIYPITSKFGFDEIFLINLKRRPERLRRMQMCFKILGINATVIQAVDGNMLTDEDLTALHIRQIPEFRDPYHNRTVTRGEIGCFLSHYEIWNNVVKRGYEKVLVFEDDLRFVRYFRYMLQNLAEDLTATKDSSDPFDWDLIYLGRKRLKTGESLKFVERGIRYVAEVGYSYWTLAYVLSQQGARKLVEADPLPKFVPVDEYLPIMFDKHPETTWKAHFPNRNLKAFTVEPLFVHPVRYTGEKGYISDTENTTLAASDKDIVDTEDIVGNGDIVSKSDFVSDNRDNVKNSDTIGNGDTIGDSDHVDNGDIVGSKDTGVDVDAKHHSVEL